MGPRAYFLNPVLLLSILLWMKRKDYAHAFES